MSGSITFLAPLLGARLIAIAADQPRLMTSKRRKTLAQAGSVRIVALGAPARGHAADHEGALVLGRVLGEPIEHSLACAAVPCLSLNPEGPIAPPPEPILMKVPAGASEPLAASAASGPDARDDVRGWVLRGIVSTAHVRPYCSAPRAPLG